MPAVVITDFACRVRVAVLDLGRKVGPQTGSLLGTPPPSLHRRVLLLAGYS